MSELLVASAAAGPAAAAAVWLGLSRWPAARRIAGGAVALAANAAAWGVFWLAYRGDAPVYGDLEPGLLGAGIGAIAGLAALLVALRADPAAGRDRPAAVVGLGVATSAVVAGGYTGSLAIAALLVPLPTLAAAAAARSSHLRRDLRGLAGLAVADVLVLAGMTVLLEQEGSSLITRRPGLVAGAAILLIGAAIKAGAVPGVGTWRLTATTGPGAVLSVPLRAQGIALAALAGLVVAGGAGTPPLAAIAAAATVLCGAAALIARDPNRVLSAVIGTAAAIPFVALGLGGAVGARAFLVLFPPFLLAVAVTMLVGWRDRAPVTASRWLPGLGSVALVIGTASLLGLPPGGGFPGTWLTLSLAGARAAEGLGALFVAGGAALGLALAAIAMVPLVRSARPRPAASAAGILGSATLVYAGSEVVRLAIGWYLRVERELDLPRLLATSGAPDLPPLPGLDLLVAAIPGVVIAAAVVVLGRGLRDRAVEFGPVLDVTAAPTAYRRPFLRPGAALRELSVRAEAAGLGLGFAIALELAAVVIAVRILLRSMGFGFL